MMFRWPHVCAIALLTASTAAAASRITFERTVPARRSLGGAEDLVITYAIGDNDRISTFIDVFVDQTNRAGTLRVFDPTSEEASTERKHRWRKPPKSVETQYRADAYLRIDAFSCHTTPRSAEGGAYDVDGNRTRRTLHWVDGVCEAHINVLAPKAKKKIAEFSVRGEGTSPRVDGVTSAERDVAIDQAARYAAVAAAEEITPRRSRETIALVEDAPQFEEGMSMIDSERFEEARHIWEAALPGHAGSAALHFNLAAVCEALGDIDAAGDHYAITQRLAPKERRYRYEREMFLRRTGRRK